MIRIEYPSYNFKIKEINNSEFIFDEIRLKWILLTPEEWVRQNIIQYFIIILNYPKSLFAIEKEILVGELKKRCDIVIYKDSKPWMIVECKSSQSKLDKKVVEQILIYHSKLLSTFIAITNGNTTLLFEKVNNKFEALVKFPSWK